MAFDYKESEVMLDELSDTMSDDSSAVNTLSTLANASSTQTSLDSPMENLETQGVSPT
jgi:hypothetical protein